MRNATCRVPSSTSKSGEITSYQYVNGFLYLYINENIRIIKCLGRFIGGRYIETGNPIYRKPQKDELRKAMGLILSMRQCLKFSEEEYSYIVFDFSEDLFKHSPTVKVTMNKHNYYGHNRTNLYAVFDNLVSVYLKAILRSVI